MKINLYDKQGNKYILIKKDGVYSVGKYLGDIRCHLYEYRAKNLDDLILQYPFIKEALMNYKFQEQLKELLNE